MIELEMLDSTLLEDNVHVEMGPSACGGSSTQSDEWCVDIYIRSIRYWVYILTINTMSPPVMPAAVIWTSQYNSGPAPPSRPFWFVTTMPRNALFCYRLV